MIKSSQLKRSFSSPYSISAGVVLYYSAVAKQNINIAKVQWRHGSRLAERWDKDDHLS